MKSNKKNWIGSILARIVDALASYRDSLTRQFEEEKKANLNGYYLDNVNSKDVYVGFSSVDIQSIVSLAGSEAEHKEIMSWAKESLSRGSLRLFNRLIDSKSLDAIKNSIKIMRTYSIQKKYRTTFSLAPSIAILYALEIVYILYFPFFGLQFNLISSLLALIIYIFFFRPVFTFLLTEDLGFFALEVSKLQKRSKRTIRSISIILILLLFTIISKVYLLVAVKLLMANLFLVLVLSPSIVIRSISILQERGIAEFLHEAQKARTSIGLMF